MWNHGKLNQRLEGIVMTGFRNRKRVNPFVQIDKSILSDESLSWKAKGILAYLLSKPDGWVTYLTDIEKRAKDGRDSVSSGIKELLDAGYLKRTRVREQGKFKGWEYSVYESPEEPTENGKAEIGETENGLSEVGKTENGKPATSNNNLSNNDLSNNDLSDINNNDARTKETAFSFYQNNGFGILTPHVGEKIGTWIDDLNEELVIYAMKISIENGVLKWNYTASILKDWFNKKFTSVEQVQAHEAQRKSQSNFKGPRPKDTAIVPDWFKEQEEQQDKSPDTVANESDLEERRRKLRESLLKDKQQD